MNAICGDCFANVAIRSCFVDTIVELRCIRRVSQKRFHDSTSRFPPLAPAGCCSPASAVLSRRYDFLPPIPPHSVAVVWRYLSVHSFCSLPDGRVSHQGLELVTRYLQPGSHRGNDRISQVPGEPQLSVCTCSNPTPAGLHAPDRSFLQCSSVALGISKAKAPTKGLSKLNSMAFGLAVYASQDGLPRHHARLASGRWSGQALPDGLSTRKVPTKGFKAASLHLIPLSQALLGTMKSTDARKHSRCGNWFCKWNRAS